MKKLIAFALLITFAFSALCVSANAATIAIKQPTSISEGVESFDPTTTQNTVKLNVGTTSNRYAVDVEFNNATTSFTTGAYTWNVSTLQYETTDATLDDTTYTCTVTNYSADDIKVIYNITVDTNLNTAGADITVTQVECSDTYDTISDYDAVKSNGDHTVTGTLKGVNKEPNAGSRSVTTATFTADLATRDGSGDWTKVANNLINNTDATANSEITIATFTVTISMITTP